MRCQLTHCKARSFSAAQQCHESCTTNKYSCKCAASWLTVRQGPSVQHSNAMMACCVKSKLRECKLCYDRCSVSLWWVTIYCIKCPSPSVNESEKLILDPHLVPDQKPNFTTSRGPLFAHTYHGWSTPAKAFVSYPAHRMTDKQQWSDNSHNNK